MTDCELCNIGMQFNRDYIRVLFENDGLMAIERDYDECFIVFPKRHAMALDKTMWDELTQAAVLVAGFLGWREGECLYAIVLDTHSHVKVRRNRIP